MNVSSANPPAALDGAMAPGAVQPIHALHASQASRQSPTPASGHAEHASRAAHAGRDSLRRQGAIEPARLLFSGAGADPRDAALFRSLLSDEDGGRPLGIGERREIDALRAMTGYPSDSQEAAAPVRGARDSVESQDQDAAPDVGAITPADLVALGSVVTKVYLDSLRDGQRAVRVELDENLLPATRLSIQEQEGRLAVDFVSTHAEARTRLRRGARALAERVARDLSRDVCVKVAAHERDPAALEARAQAPGIAVQGQTA